MRYYPETAPPIDLRPQRQRFQHRYGIHAVLLVATMFTTSLVGGCNAIGFQQARGESGAFPLLEIIVLGLSYSLPFIIILGVHELGHYFYCRKHQVDATLPYFLPAPIPLTGTLGAVIKIREPFPTTRALFDIGVAGPIAGFLALLPFLFWGVSMSIMIPFEPGEGTIYFGEPLLFKAVAWLQFGTRPEGHDIILHPMGFAAWFGLLATALNMLPFGQLDGGHIVYALIGRRASYVSLATLAATLLLTTYSASWWSMSVMMLAMALLIGFGHPRVLDESVALDGRRKFIAFLAFVIFAVSFTPVPIELFFDQ